jgi:hypothetical protein
MVAPIDAVSASLQAPTDGFERRGVGLRFPNPFTALFARSTGEQQLIRYVIRECSRGRSLNHILNDHYVRNLASAQERAKLLDRPEIIAAASERTRQELKLGSRWL